MNVAIFWTGVTATMSAAYRALDALPGVRLKVYLELPSDPDTAYVTEMLLAGLDAFVRRADEPLDTRALVADVAAFGPDVMLVLGWRCPMCRAVATSRRLAAVPAIFAFDMPFAFTVRKLLAPVFLWRYLRRFAAAFVTGRRATTYARYLGFPDARIETGLFGMDTTPFLAARRDRPEAARFPRQFLYVGRYAREKRLDVLVAAYARYRGRVVDPWGLTCAGMGPEKPRLAGQPGITDLGFVQPNELPAVFARHGCFVIASDYDPWPMAIAEALASGMPVVCTAACGSHVELVRPDVNGRVVNTGDVTSLAAALEWVHTHAADLPAMSPHCTAAAEPYSASQWAERMLTLCQRLIR